MGPYVISPIFTLFRDQPMTLHCKNHIAEFNIASKRILYLKFVLYFDPFSLYLLQNILFLNRHNRTCNL